MPFNPANPQSTVPTVVDQIDAEIQSSRSSRQPLRAV